MKDTSTQEQTMNGHERGQVVASAAELYEQFFVPALFVDWPARLCAAAALQPGDAVLDVACGTGILAREAARHVRPDGAVIGVDINEGMLAVAEVKAPDLTWKAGAAESLPFADATFDQVMCQFGLMFFADQRQALAEMARVLRPGGQLTVAVWAPLDATPGYAAVASILHDLFGPDVARSIEAPYTLGDVQQLQALFAAAGLENVQIQTLPGTARFASIEAWIYTDIRAWTLADVIDDEEYARLQRYAPAKLAHFVQPDGSVAFDTPAHIVTARV